MESQIFFTQKMMNKKFLEYGNKFTSIPQQQEFLASPAKYRLLSCGLGGGKTTLICFDIIRHLLSPQYAGATGLLVAPTVPMLIKAALVKIYEILSYLPESTVKSHNRSEKKIVFSNGSTLYYMHGSDPDAFRGIEVALLAIDEAALLLPEAAQNAYGRVRQSKYPNRIMCASTPKGKANWLYEEFIENPSKQHAHFNWSSYDNLGFGLSQDYINLLERTFPPGSKLHEQEVLGSFVSFSGRVYDFENYFDKKPPYKNFDKIYGGIDFGISAPTTAIIIGHNKLDDKLYLLEEFYERDLNTNEFLPLIKEIQDRIGVQMFYADPEDANAISILKKGGVKIIPAKNDVLPGIKEVLNHQHHLLINRECIYTISESKSYSWHTHPTTHEALTDRNPIKGSDHTLDALRYCIYNGFTSAKTISSATLSVSSRNKVARW